MVIKEITRLLISPPTSQVALANTGNMKDQGLTLGLEDPLEEEMATHSSILVGESQGQRSLVDCHPWGHKESDRTEVT